MRPFVSAFLVLFALWSTACGQDAASPAPAVLKPPQASSAPVPASSPSTAPVIQSAPVVYHQHTLANTLVSASISDFQGSLISFSLLDCHPILLHQWQIDKLTAANEKPLDPTKPLPVLDDFYPGGGKNNWISGIGLPVPLRDPEAKPWAVTEGGNSLDLFNHDAVLNVDYNLSYQLPKNSPSLSSTLIITNHGTKDFAISPRLFPFNGLHQDDPTSDSSYLCVAYSQGGVAGTQTNLGMPTPPTPAKPLGSPLTIPAPLSNLDYVALKSRFFAALWEPGAVVLSGAGAPAAAPTAPAPLAPAKPLGESGGPDSVPLPDQGLPLNGSGGISASTTATGYRVTNARGSAVQAYVQVRYLAAGDKPIVLTPGQSVSISWRLVITSMRKHDLAHLSAVERRVEYTDGYYRFFKVLSNILTYVLDWVAAVVRNYGLALLVVTFLIKLALHRTNHKQQESMFKMQKLSPELKLLQERYKGDKQALATKQMELWKKNGVNPLGGCLPILLQTPIFIALYQAFSHSADMRGQSFLWINDLTLPDQVYGFMLMGFNLTLNPLPLIYIGVTIWMSMMQKLPTGGDPQQEQTAKMVRWMPVFLGFIFYNMPAGLVLYFTTNAILSTIETKMVRNKLGMK